MTNFSVHKDEVDWLIIITCTTDDNEIKAEAISKLSNFGLTDDQIKNRFKEIDSEEAQKQAFEKSWKIQQENNESEKYTTFEKMKIFFIGPYELLTRWNTGLIELHKSNYKTKFRQKLILLVAGTTFWLLLVIISYKYYEYQRLKDIKKVDLNEWEKNSKK